MTRNLFAAEWLKITRRPLAWIVLAAFLFLMALYLGLWFLIVVFQEGALSGGELRLEVLGPAQVAAIKHQLGFPGIFGAVLGQVNSTGGICAMILAAGAFGSDYGWGTLRALLARAPGRGAYLAAKLLALLAALLLGIVIALLVGCGLALIFSAALGLPNQLGLRDLLVLPLGVLRALLVILPYLLITCVCANFGRSVLAGAGGGLVFLALDVGAGSFGALGDLSDLVRFLLNLLLQPNINALVVANSALYGIDQSVLVSGMDLAQLPSPLQATLVIVAYSALFTVSAYRLLQGRDVGGAG